MILDNFPIANQYWWKAIWKKHFTFPMDKMSTKSLSLYEAQRSMEVFRSTPVVKLQRCSIIRNLISHQKLDVSIIYRRIY